MTSKGASNLRPRACCTSVNLSPSLTEPPPFGAHYRCTSTTVAAHFGKFSALEVKEKTSSTGLFIRTLSSTPIMLVLFLGRQPRLGARDGFARSLPCSYGV